MPDPRTEVTLALSQWQQLHLRHIAHRRIVVPPIAQRVLVLIPHPDDEVLGLGGTLLRLAGSAKVELVYLTDGRIGAGDRADEPRMAAVRAAEAHEVAARLGFGPPVLVGWNEHSFAAPEHAPLLIAKVAEVLQRVQPDLVFTPFLWEAHGDHRYVNHLLAQALLATGQRPTVCGYEVWSMAPPGWVVDISAQLEQKIELMRCYRSQLAILDYLEVARLRAALHAPLVPGASACEVFWPVRGEAYLDIVGAADLASPAAQRTIALLTAPETLP
jgi:LmbE family N-acetylglucosaminyl deacetylase